MDTKKHRWRMGPWAPCRVCGSQTRALSTWGDQNTARCMVHGPTTQPFKRSRLSEMLAMYGKDIMEEQAAFLAKWV